MKYLLVVGSREFQNYTLMCYWLDKEINGRKDICIISGGARGADALAKIYAKARNYEYKEFPAQWNKYGKRAGYIRNEEMHKFISEKKEKKCIAFWDRKSKGTQHNFGMAEKYKNEIKIIKY